MTAFRYCKHETWAGPCGATVLGGLDLCRDHAKTPAGCNCGIAWESPTPRPACGVHRVTFEDLMGVRWTLNDYFAKCPTKAYSEVM